MLNVANIIVNKNRLLLFKSEQFNVQLHLSNADNKHNEVV